MREKHQHQDAKASKSEDDTQPAVDIAMRKEAQTRKLAGKAKQKLHSHVDSVSKSMLLGANIFQQMVRGDSEEALQKKLEPAIAEKLGEKVLDKVLDKVKDTLCKITGFGEEMAEKSVAIFGAIRSNVTDKIKTRGELTSLHVADEVTNGLIESQAVVEDNLKAKIDQLSPEQLAEIAKMLFKLRESAKDAEDDSPEHGKLADGMENWAMTDLLGMPAGDGVAAEDTARNAYNAFREGVREFAMSTGEATADIQRALTHPHETDDKMEEVEKGMGGKTKGNIDKDKALRERVDETGMAGGKS